MTPAAESSRKHGSTRGVDRSRQTYHRLRELIVHGRLAPGTRIVETEIADRLGVSRTPVRAALQRLQQEGYINAPADAKQSRPSVAPLTQEDARELFFIVGEIEGLAARWAADLPKESRGTLAEELQRTNEAYLSLARTPGADSNELFALDTHFHRRYTEAGAGPRLLSLHDAIKPQAERYIRLYIAVLTEEIATSVSEHQVIVDAIAAGTPDAAQLAVQSNWRNAAGRLYRAIRTAGERGSW
jgi:DNA-binding GntR family transcriptional regulator